MQRQIFVFGSNLAGRHGAGAAKTALKKYKAVYGEGYGLQGESFAIPTKDKQLKSLPLETIGLFVEHFKRFASNHPNLIFNVTAIGCGLAGYKPSQIAPFFKQCTQNVILPKQFKDILDV